MRWAIARWFDCVPKCGTRRRYLNQFANAAVQVKGSIFPIRMRRIWRLPFGEPAPCPVLLEQRDNYWLLSTAPDPKADAALSS